MFTFTSGKILPIFDCDSGVSSGIDRFWEANKSVKLTEAPPPGVIIPIFLPFGI